MSKVNLEEHLNRSCTDDTFPPAMPPVTPPEHELHVRPPGGGKWTKLYRARAATSAPGPNRGPYRLHKHAPGVPQFLWKLMKVVQKKETPTSSRELEGSSSQGKPQLAFTLAMEVNLWASWWVVGDSREGPGRSGSDNSFQFHSLSSVGPF